MKHLLVLATAYVGARENASAPTFWKTMNKFEEKGWKICIITAAKYDEKNEAAEHVDSEVTVVRCPIPSKKWMRKRFVWRLEPFVQAPRYNEIFYGTGKKYLLENDCTAENTVIYADDAYAVHAGKKLSTKFNMKLVTRFCGMWDMIHYPPNLKNSITQFPKPKAYATPADLVIVTNDGTRGDEVIRRAGNKSPMVFWRNGVDVPPCNLPVPSFLAKFSPDDPVLVVLSRLHSGKKVDRSIRAMKTVKEKYPNARLIICGYGPEKDRLEALVSELGLRKNVFFVGSIPHDEVFAYLQNADIFLSFYDESNLGNPIFEAMRCGCAIITSDVGATRDIIHDGENGILLPPENLEENIPAAILRLLDHPEEIKRLGECAEKYAAENFRTWDERTSAEEKEISRLLEKNKQGEN